MSGVIVNTLAVIAGSLIGLIFKRAIPSRIADAAMIGIGLCSIYIGVSGTLSGENMLIIIGSVVSGGIIGTALCIHDRLDKLGEKVALLTRSGTDSSGKVAQGFVTASLLFCVGAMTFVGSLNAGLLGDNSLLYAKSLLDFISSTMLSATLGIGVLCAAAFVLVFQGGLVLLAGVLEPLLTQSAINEMTCAGSILIIGLALNILGITKLKIADYLPAIVTAPIICWIVSLI